MDDNFKRNVIKGILLLAVVLVVCLFIPYSYWDTDIVSGRLVSEGTIVEQTSDSVVVRLYTMTASDDMLETDTFLEMEGVIPDDAYIGQRVRIGYSSSNGLYSNLNQTVQISYYTKGNILTGLILDWIVPFQSTETDLEIVSIHSDGSQLVYNRAS